LRKVTRVRKRLTWGAMALAGLMVCASAGAQISLSATVDLALHNDPKTRMAQADVDRAKAAYSEAKDAFVPVVGISGGVGKSVGAPLGLPTVFGLNSQSLAFNFSQWDNIRAARLGLKAAELAMQEVREQVAEDTVITYLNLSNAQQRQAAATQEYGFATRLVGIVQDRIDAGRDNNVELLRARRTAAQIHLQMLQTDDQIVTLTDHLGRLIGLPGNPLQTLPGSIPAFPSEGSTINPAALSYGVRSSFVNATSKQEYAFGQGRYRWRPQISLAGNYSRLNTSQSQSNFLDYYPAFKGKSNNDASIALEIQIPLFDRAHEDRAHEAAADALHAHFEAQNQKNLFLEGRIKLQHSIAELSDQSKIAELDQELAQQQIDAVVVQLQASAGSSDQPPMTPKDEQNARLQERARTIDLLNAQSQLSQAEVNLLRQTGQLDDWLKLAIAAPGSATTQVVKP